MNLWYKNAVIYCVDLDAYMDSDGDGYGDFRGLSARLDHIERLGATCLWLLPFFPSAGLDNGYDVTDFYAVDPRFGSLGDFVEFMHYAADHGLRVLVDLVVNHTSTKHPWFRAARSDPKSSYRDWYIWSKKEPKDAHEGMVFPGPQRTTWSFDEAAGEWYFHRFYEHQADLNTANPKVREEIQKIVGFWLELGVSGFRVDAVPFLLEHPGPSGGGDSARLLDELNAFLVWRRAGAVLLAEANVTMAEAKTYVGDGDRMHLVFNFLQNQHVWLAFAREDAGPIENIIRASPAFPPISQWVTFLRNHDELDLGRLPEKQRNEVFAAFGPDETMQVYGRGIRRRLAPMLEGNISRLKMAFSLMLSLPGTPMIWYGDEIGLGEDLSLKERESVRLPLQWDSERNGGFSTAERSRLVRPVVRSGPFSYRNVNVAAQRTDPESLLNTIGDLVILRRSAPEIGWGECTILKTSARSVLALRYDWRGGAVVVAHNLASRAASVTLHIEEGRGESLTQDGAGPLRSGMAFELEGYGYRWYRLGGERR